jgi:hypothetical protein
MPRKTFTAGDVLTAADVNLYLSNEAVFASSTATTYTVLTSDRYETLVMAGTANSTISFSTATAFIAGERIDILQEGAGTVTIARDGTAVSFAGRGTAGTAYTIGQRYDAVSVVCVGTDSYRIIGNATAV